MPTISPLRAVDIKSQEHPTKSGSSAVEIANDYLTPYSSGRRTNGTSPKPVYDVFLGGSCGNTVWRRDLVIPYLEKRAISYYDPQRSVWNEHMINEESIAKENSSLFLFVLDPATVNATSFLEIAHFAARKAPKLAVVFLDQSEWKERAHPEDLPDRRRTCDLLDNILTTHDVPVLQSIQEALTYIDEVIIGEKSWSEAMSNPMQRLPYLLFQGKRTCRQSVKRVGSAMRRVKNGIARWKGTKFLLLGIFEILSLLTVHYFFSVIPLMMLIVPLFAFDVILAVISTIYYCYKVHAAARRRAKLLEQRDNIVGGTSTPIPIPGRGRVPCNIVAQQVPLSYSHKATNPYSLNDDTSVASNLLVTRSNSSSGAANPLQWINAFGYDVYLGCSSRNRADLAWINNLAAPQLHRKGLAFCSELMVERHKRLSILHKTRHILYHIPSCETVLSGMVEVAYFLGHTNLHLTICIPKRAKMLACSPNDNEELKKHIERRNESYRMAFCYLRDMAERRRCEVFSQLDDALRFVICCSKEEFLS